MAINKEPSIKHLVVDAVGFLKLTSLEKIGEKIYTTRDVVNEIRDQATKQRLQILPYELHYVEPTPENLKHVMEFSKKTGDFPSLSVTDLGLIAVVYQLEKEFGDVSRLRNVPVVTKTYSTTKKLTENPKDVVGFFLPQKGKPSDDSDVTSKLDSLRLSSTEPDSNVDDQNSKTLGGEIENEAPAEIEEDRQKSPDHLEVQESDEESEESGDEDRESGDEEEESDDDKFEEEAVNEEDDGDGDGGWITPGNVQSAIAKARRDEGGVAVDENQPIPVACLSTDFAVQNVLLHMGLRLTSMDGMMIKRLRTYVLRCFGCFKTTSIMTKRFCPECGNPTLKKVAVTVNPDTGMFEYHLSKRKRISTRGTKFSLPTFKGGKHSSNPVLSADQPTADNRLSKKALQQLDVLDPDYMARDSPFLMKDVTSRSATIGVRGLQKTDGRRNPNEWKCGRKRGGKKR